MYLVIVYSGGTIVQHWLLEDEPIHNGHYLRFKNKRGRQVTIAAPSVIIALADDDIWKGDDGLAYPGAEVCADYGIPEGEITLS